MADADHPPNGNAAPPDGNAAEQKQQVPDVPQSRQAGGGGGPTKSTTVARVIRENDMMRSEADAVILDLAVTSVSLRASGSFRLDDHVKIRLQNVVQRCDREVRGVVRMAEPAKGGTTLVFVELQTRLAPLDLSMLKMGIAAPQGDSQPKWV